MNLHALLLERKAAGRPVTVGLIGAGKFGTMFLIAGAAHRRACISSASPISTWRARRSSSRPPDGRRSNTRRASLDDALKHGGTLVTDDAGLR